jgi:hypothetical protein
MEIEFVAKEKLLDTQKKALDKLWANVYPPEVIETLSFAP